MDTLIVFVVCVYVLFESYTALEAMPGVSIFRIFHELFNPYAVKYWLCGLYSLLLIYHIDQLSGWHVLAVIPPVYLVSGRFIYRINSLKWPRNN